jgi:uncharacterized protein DUF3859
MRHVLTLLFLAVSTASAFAQSRVERIEIVEAGIYTAETTDRYNSSQTAAGNRANLSSVKLAVSTTRVPLQQNIRFGFRYRVLGGVAGERVQIKGITRFPPPGLRNDAGKVFTTDEYTLNAEFGQIRYNGYTFDHAWEMVPGTWTFELWHDGRKLASHSFVVTKP